MAGGVVVVLAGLIIEWSTGTNVDDPDSVVREWSGTIRMLGVEPAYPPEEDLHVGDLFAAIVEDDPAKLDAIPLTARAIKLDHIDMDIELKREYERMPLFPETLPKPNGAEEIWQQQKATVELFSGRAMRTYLPLALFPGFSIGHNRSATTALGSQGSLHALLHMNGGSDSNTALRIPIAETYGVPSLVASGHLIEYCAADRTSPVCSDSVARDQLSQVIGDRIYQKVDGAFRYKVELYMLNRVYLTRSIEKSTSANSSVGVSATATPAPSGDKSDASGGKPANSLNVASRDRLESAVSQVLMRPVVFGFRAVHRDLTSPTASP